MSWKKSYNPKIALWGFILSVFLSMLLFAGLFTSRSEYIAEHTFDTIYILTLGILTPVFFIIGIVFLLISYYQYQSFSIRAKIIITISIIVLLVYYFFSSLGLIIDLIKIL